MSMHDRDGTSLWPLVAFPGLVIAIIIIFGVVFVHFFPLDVTRSPGYQSGYYAGLKVAHQSSDYDRGYAQGSRDLLLQVIAMVDSLSFTSHRADTTPYELLAPEASKEDLFSD